jgi:hypothetical protein
MEAPNDREGSLGPSLGDGVFVQLVELWGTARRRANAKEDRSFQSRLCAGECSTLAAQKMRTLLPFDLRRDSVPDAQFSSLRVSGPPLMEKSVPGGHARIALRLAVFRSSRLAVRLFACAATMPGRLRNAEVLENRAAEYSHDAGAFVGNFELSPLAAC